MLITMQESAGSAAVSWTADVSRRGGAAGAARAAGAAEGVDIFFQRFKSRNICEVAALLS
jgi:hypothetical protein